MDQPPKTSRRVKMVLTASLALNLLFIGLIVGAITRHGDERGPAGPRLGSYGVPYMQALPRAERRAVGQVLRQAGAIPDRQARRKMYAAVLEHLRAEPFDAAALDAVMHRQGQAAQDVQAAAQAAWLGVVSEMPRAARLDYAQALEDRLRRKRLRGKKDRD